MRFRFFYSGVLAAVLLPVPAAAHPHIFVDTGFAFEFDDAGRLSQVKVTWQYDEFYSLLITEDLQLDQDGDGILTPAERARLIGFDTNWDEGFNGDLEIHAGGARLALSGPLEATTALDQGRIISSHIRRIAPTDRSRQGPISMKAFDPSYYTAYDITLPVTLPARQQGECLLELIEPDIVGGLAQMQAQLLRLDANADLEENDFPLIGGEFATEIRVSCSTS